MERFKKFAVISALLVIGVIAINVSAATTPSLGAASGYTLLASTFTNTSAGTVINGSIGFTTGPAVTPGGTHPNYGSLAPYAAAGTDQSNALATLNSQACTFTFGGGAINLSTDTTHGPIGIYSPGVYCSSGAMNIGGPLTLTGSGTYIFRSGGALTSTAGAVVTLSGSAACDVFWTPAGATTLAANTTFFGTVIDNAGITVGANTNWTGSALSFGGTITTDTDTLTLSACAVATPTPTATPVPTSSPTPTPTATPTLTPTPTATSTPTITPSPTSTPVFTATPTASPSASATPIPKLPNTGVAPDEN